MICDCYQTNDHFIFRAREVPEELEDALIAAWWEKEENVFLKKYPIDVVDKELVSVNYPKYGPAMFSGKGTEWRAALKQFAEGSRQEGFRWALIGSGADAVRGAALTPHDLDIYIHTDDYYRAKDLFKEFVVEPFTDNKGTWLVRYFGRLCLCATIVDVAANENETLENGYYESFDWQGFKLLLEPFESRYNTEVKRNRKDRIALLDEYIQRTMK